MATGEQNGVDVDDEITLQEALEAQELLEEQSAAVLGASDPQNCSYSKGYMKRQALYACLTCNPKGAPFYEPAAVCLACSYTCHEGHDLVELFTKRNFRCDCGNRKFPDNTCRLQKEKDPVNVQNEYNQNFTGNYCTCHRPYPDPDQDEESAHDAMIQCIICEDWFHFQHTLAYLNVDFETLGDFELICGLCVSKLDFLGHYYEHLAMKPCPDTHKNETDNATAGAAASESKPQQISESASDPIISSTPSEGESKGHNSDGAHNGLTSVVFHNGSETSGDSNANNAKATCELLKNSKKALPTLNGQAQAVGWKESLRTSLCKCESCLEMYERLKIQFLLDVEDTIGFYEELGKKKSQDAQLSAQATIDQQVNNLGRVGQLEFLHGYNQFKEQLADFLKQHADNGTVVQREDVNNFFARFNEEQAAKRRRLE